VWRRSTESYNCPVTLPRAFALGFNDACATFPRHGIPHRRLNQAGHRTRHKKHHHQCYGVPFLSIYHGVILRSDCEVHPQLTSSTIWDGIVACSGGGSLELRERREWRGAAVVSVAGEVVAVDPRSEEVRTSPWKAAAVQRMPVHKQVRRHRPSPGFPRRLCESAASLSCSHDTLSEDSNGEEDGSSSLVQDGFSTDEKISMGMIVKKVRIPW
jgi:hypothetical protein